MKRNWLFVIALLVAGVARADSVYLDNLTRDYVDKKDAIVSGASLHVAGDNTPTAGMNWGGQTVSNISYIVVPEGGSMNISDGSFNNFITFTAADESITMPSRALKQAILTDCTAMDADQTNEPTTWNQVRAIGTNSFVASTNFAQTTADTTSTNAYDASVLYAQALSTIVSNYMTRTRTKYMDWGAVCPTNMPLGSIVGPFPDGVSTGSLFVVKNGAQTNIWNVWRHHVSTNLSAAASVIVITNLACNVGMTTNPCNVVLTNGECLFPIVSGMGAIISTNYLDAHMKVEGN